MLPRAARAAVAKAWPSGQRRGRAWNGGSPGVDSVADGILRDITVIDMTEGVAGPYTSMMLGDMGANVIKVERPEGDWSRTSGKGAVVPEIGSAQFIYLNRNKRNLGLDIAKPGGREIIERLIGRADVLVSNYRAGVMAKLGLDYGRCKALRSDIIYCTISGFGQEGPYAQYPASDTIMQAMTGIMSLIGEPDGPPLRAGFPLIDLAAATHAIQAVLLALYGRTSGRGGAEIDISLMAAGLSMMGAQFSDFLAAGRLPERQGNQNASLAPAGAFKVEGGRYISIAVLRDSHWRKFCAAMGLEHLVDDTRFATNAARVRNRAALDEVIAPMLASRSSEYWLERLRAADILCGPINTLADVEADPAIAGRLPLIDPLVPGVPRILGAPIRYDGAYFTTRIPTAPKGRDTRLVLAEAGFAPAEVETFLRAGAAFIAETG